MNEAMKHDAKSCTVSRFYASEDGITDTSSGRWHIRQPQNKAWAHKGARPHVYRNCMKSQSLKVDGLHHGYIQVQMWKHLEKTLFARLEFPLICQYQATELLFQNMAANADIPIRHPPPLLSGSPLGPLVLE